MFVINVFAGQEKRFVLSLNKEGFTGYSPEMIKTYRKGGRWHEKKAVIFTGYIFIDIDAVSAEAYQRIKLLPNFRSFLSIAAPLPEAEEEYIKTLSLGSELCRGKITDSGFVITEGLLSGIRHKIIVFNKRQRTAVAELNLYGEPRRIKFSVEII